MFTPSERTYGDSRHCDSDSISIDFTVISHAEQACSDCGEGKLLFNRNQENQNLAPHDWLSAVAVRECKKTAETPKEPNRSTFYVKKKKKGEVTGYIIPVGDPPPTRHHRRTDGRPVFASMERKNMQYDFVAIKTLILPGRLCTKYRKVFMEISDHSSTKEFVRSDTDVGCIGEIDILSCSSQIFSNSIDSDSDCV